MTLSLRRSPLRTPRFAALVLALPLAGPMGCDAEDDPEVQAEAQAVADDVPDDLIDAVVDVPEHGDGLVGDVERPLELTAQNDPQAFSFRSWHSEETPGDSECPVGQVVTGFDCSGRFCDRVRIECHNYGGSVPSASNAFSGWFEVGPPPGFAGNPKRMHICASNEKMTGIDCRGSYCDDISIECSPTSGLGTSRCGWSNWFSDEDPTPFLAPTGTAIQGVWCSGTHCDDKRFLVCEI